MVIKREEVNPRRTLVKAWKNSSLGLSFEKGFGHNFKNFQMVEHQ
jgi:hypothetical protein